MKYLITVLLMVYSVSLLAQNPIGGMTNRIRGMRGATQGAGHDTLGKRNKLEDSITISFRYLDTARAYKLDSSINDFTARYPIPATNYYLGNTGSATQSYLFSPLMKAGWDPGFHAYDVYKYTVDKARFFTATRPYSELNYMLGTRSEQYIELMHTQNRKPNWNFAFQYRLINAPGLYKNQKTSHNNYLFTNWVHSTNKRYNNYIIIAANKLQGTESGGMQDPTLLDDPRYADRYSIPTWLGGDSPFGKNFFNTNVTTGNKYNDFNAVMRQQFDFGRKDSLVTDSSVVKLFFPRVRAEHTIRYSKYKYWFTDNAANYGDAVSYYRDHYDTTSRDGNFNLKDTWSELVNDFSLYTFPDSKNTQQYIKLGAAVQNIKGSFDSAHSRSDYNVFGHAEYRNRSKNQKWDMQAFGQLYFVGRNAGDYQAAASVQSLLGKKIGTLKLGFENVNRSPIAITDTLSNFYLMKHADGSKEMVDLKKENITHLYAQVYQPLIKLGLSADYYLVSNYVYYTDFYKINQAGALFNVLQLGANKVFEAGRKKQWKWRADVYFQQVIGNNAPVNLPMIFTRNRFGYEGDLGYPHLRIAMGFEVKYRTNYKGNNYSPLLGQFFYQNDSTVQYKLPDIAAYVHFRIGAFKTFFRLENLNTFRNLNGDWGFNNNNFAAPGYAYPGLMLRLGIFWGFVN